MMMGKTKVFAKVVKGKPTTVSNPIGEMPKKSGKAKQKNTATFKSKR